MKWHLFEEQIWTLPFIHFRLSLVTLPWKGLAVKTHVSFAISRIQPTSFLWFPENRPPCSHSFLLSTFWQILTSLECLSGHLRTLFTVYGLTRVHVQTLWWCSVRYFMLLQFQVPLPAGYWWVVASSSNHWALSTTAVSFFLLLLLRNRCLRARQLTVEKNKQYPAGLMALNACHDDGQLSSDDKVCCL